MFYFSSELFRIVGGICLPKTSFIYTVSKHDIDHGIGYWLSILLPKIDIRWTLRCLYKVSPFLQINIIT